MALNNCGAVWVYCQIKIIGWTVEVIVYLENFQHCAGFSWIVVFCVCVQFCCSGDLTVDGVMLRRSGCRDLQGKEVVCLLLKF